MVILYIDKYSLGNNIFYYLLKKKYFIDYYPQQKPKIIFVMNKIFLPLLVLLLSGCKYPVPNASHVEYMRTEAMQACLREWVNSLDIFNSEGLKKAINSIQNPTVKALNASKKYGNEFGPSAFNKLGLRGVIEQISLKGLAKEEILSQFFDSLEARTAILSLIDNPYYFKKNGELVYQTNLLRKCKDDPSNRTILGILDGSRLGDPIVKKRFSY